MENVQYTLHDRKRGETLLLSITKRSGIIKFMASCLASVGRHPAVQVEEPTIVQALQPDLA